MPAERRETGIGVWLALGYIVAMYMWYYYAWGKQLLDYLTNKFFR